MGKGHINLGLFLLAVLAAAQQVLCGIFVDTQNDEVHTTRSLRGGEKEKQSRRLQQAVAGSKFTSVNSKPLSKRKPDPKMLPNVPQSTRVPKSKTRQYEYYRMYDQIHNVTLNPEYALKATQQNKYYLSIIAIFKNEACGMKEWLDHHIGHGVEHFYLVDDDSTDHVLDVLKPYIDKNLVTMHASTSRWVPFRQTGIYKRVFNSVYAQNESKWIAIIDLDEYLYAPRTVNIKDVLKQNEDLSVIGVNWMWFGSSGYINQPTNIIQSFTKRASTDMTKYPSLIENYKVLKPSKSPESDWQKYIVNTAFKVDNIDIHTVVIEGTSACLSNCVDPVNPLLLINHYATQSKDFFLKVKGPRGDVNNWVAVGAKNAQWFATSDINENPDTRLADQNKKANIALEPYSVCDMSVYASLAPAAPAAPAATTPAAPAATTPAVPAATATKPIPPAAPAAPAATATKPIPPAALPAAAPEIPAPDMTGSLPVASVTPPAAAAKPPPVAPAKEENQVYQHYD